MRKELKIETIVRESVPIIYYEEGAKIIVFKHVATLKGEKIKTRFLSMVFLVSFFIMVKSTLSLTYDTEGENTYGLNDSTVTPCIIIRSGIKIFIKQKSRLIHK